MPLLPPTFADVAMFGVAVEMKIAEFNPVRYQQTTYAGLDGVEDAKLGEEGATTTITGRIVGADESTFYAAWSTLRDSHRLGKKTLVDSFGNAWPLCRLQHFTQASRISKDMGTGELSARYEAKFFHVVLPSS